MISKTLTLRSPSHFAGVYGMLRDNDVTIISSTSTSIIAEAEEPIWLFLDFKVESGGTFSAIT
jgi:hypothetical protein